MKKLNRTHLLLLLVALFAISCKKEKSECSSNEEDHHELSACQSYKSSTSFPQETEVHSISVYNAVSLNCEEDEEAIGTFTIEGEISKNDYILALVGYDAIKWNIDDLIDGSSENGSLRGIIISGYHCQKLENVPSDIPISIITHAGGSESEYFTPWDAGDSSDPYSDTHDMDESKVYLDSCIKAQTGNAVVSHLSTASGTGVIFEDEGEEVTLLNK